MINESGYDSFIPDPAIGIPAHRRVKLVPGTRKITLADADDREIAVTKVATVNNKYPQECRLVNAGGSLDVEVNGAVESGQTVKRDDDGKVAVAGAGSEFGIADESVTDEAGSVIPF